MSKQSNNKIKLVGPYNQNDYKDLDNIENISLLGEKQGKNLISILKKADVCLAPYKICKDTEEVYTMPNKFWLYLNFGLPIVTCEIKKLFKLPNDFVYQAKDKFEFVDKVICANSKNSFELFSKRRLFIEKNNWNNRVKQLINLYEMNHEKY